MLKNYISTKVLRNDKIKYHKYLPKELKINIRKENIKDGRVEYRFGIKKKIIIKFTFH